MLLVLLAIILWVPAVLGWGSLVGARIEDRGLRVAVLGFLGLAVLSGVGSAVSLFTAASPSMAAAGLVVGYLAFGWQRPLAGPDPTPAWAMLMAAAGAAGLTLEVGRHYDTGLYYLQAVRWITERGPTYGLANLHGRLGFGSAWMPLAAMLEVPGLGGRSALVAGALPLVLAVPAVASGVRRVAAGEASWPALLQIGLAVPLLLGLQGIGSLHTDHPASLAGCLALVLLVSGVHDRSPPLVGSALLLATFAFTIKLSVVVLLFGALLAFLRLVRSLSLVDRLRYAGGSAALLALWGARGLQLSGCVGWPATAACLSVPWTPPAEQGHQLAAVIQRWARRPGRPTEVALGSWDWLWPWCQTHFRSSLAWAVLATAVVGSLAAWRRRRDAPVAAWWAAGISAGGAAFWFVAAPDPRFGLVYLLGGPLAFLACDCSVGIASGKLSPRRLFRAGLIGAMVVALAGLGSLARARPTWAEVRFFRWPEFPGARTRVVTTTGGLSVLVPVGSDQCWLAPLPCTPRVVPGLAFREGHFVVITPPSSTLDPSVRR